jgi:hypothetical protein
MGAKESAVAKSIGPQEQKDWLPQDSALYRVIESKKKISKKEAAYRRRQEQQPPPQQLPERGRKQSENDEEDVNSARCVQCKFNLGDERKCHIVGGMIDNEHGISKFFSPKGAGMLPGDIVWEFVKINTRNKLAYKEGHVIRNGAPGFQCKDCKYYLYSHNCLLIKGRFRPEMSCGFIVKIGNGTEV